MASVWLGAGDQLRFNLAHVELRSNRCESKLATDSFEYLICNLSPKMFLADSTTSYTGRLGSIGPKFTEKEGFWQSMDTLREKQELEKYAAQATPPCLNFSAVQ